MKYFYIVIALLLLNNTIILNAQTIRVIKVCDSVTKLPIPYSTIRTNDFNTGTFANHEGYFELTSDFTDSLLISSIGYLMRKMNISEIINNTIYLTPQIQELKPVLVKPRKKVGEEIVGIVPEKNEYNLGVGGAGEYAQKIIFKDSTKEYLLKQININTLWWFDDSVPLLIHIYSVGIDGFPNEDLLLNKVLVTKENFKKKKMKLVIDLSKEKILINDPSFFISLEWLPSSSKLKKKVPLLIKLTDEYPNALTYLRSTNGKWQLFNNNKSKITNTIMAAVVDVLE